MRPEGVWVCPKAVDSLADGMMRKDSPGLLPGPSLLLTTSTDMAGFKSELDLQVLGMGENSLPSNRSPKDRRPGKAPPCHGDGKTAGVT